MLTFGFSFGIRVSTPITGRYLTKYPHAQQVKFARNVTGTTHFGFRFGEIMTEAATGDFVERCESRGQILRFHFSGTLVCVQGIVGPLCEFLGSLSWTIIDPSAGETTGNV